MPFKSKFLDLFILQSCYETWLSKIYESCCHQAWCPFITCVYFLFFNDRLFEVEEILNKKQAYIEKKVEEEIAIIKTNGTKNKRVSLAALKRKKRLEKQLEQIDGKSCDISFIFIDASSV